MTTKTTYPDARKHPWGKMMYVHPEFLQEGIYLPSDLGKLESIVNVCLENFPRRSFDERRAIIRIVRQMIDTIGYSPAIDYACSWITGDVGEIRKLVVDGDVKEVLVVPQGLRRAQISSQHFAATRTHGHPLTGNAEKMLEVMARTMVASELSPVYFRGKCFADGTNPAALNHDVLHSMFVGTTWQFSADPPYKLPRETKVIVESPHALRGHPLSKYKVSNGYQERVVERRDILTTEQAKTAGANDIAYFAPNGLLVDLTCQNIAFVVPHPFRKDWVKMIFPEGSHGNYFFQGKTEQTLYELLERFGPEEGVEPVRVKNPEQFAQEAGDRYYDLACDTGISFTRKTILEQVQQGGMLAMGTYKGAQWIDGYITEDFKERITFEWSGRTKQAAQWIMNMFQDATWALHGGVSLPDGTCVAADPMYCTLFEVNKVKEGIVQPLKFRTVEDITK